MLYNTYLKNAAQLLRSEEEAPYTDRPHKKIGTTILTETDKKNNPAPPDLIWYVHTIPNQICNFSSQEKLSNNGINSKYGLRPVQVVQAHRT